MPPAFYSDGKTAQRHEVELSIVGGSLWLRTGDGEVDEKWDGPGMRLLEEAYSGKPLRLQHNDHRDAVITIDHAELRQRVLTAFPHLSVSLVRGSPISRLVTWTALTTLAIVAMIVGIPLLAVSMSREIPDEWTDKLGEVIVDNLVDADTACNGEEGLAALRGLAERLQAVSGFQGPVTVQVADISSVNAIAAPGGHIVVFRGLIDATDDAGQVAGVLAHEFAHVIENHPIEGLARHLALRVVIALIVGDLNGLAVAAADLGGDAMAANYDREMETQADRLAVRLLNDAGFDAGGLEAFFRDQSQEDTGETPDVVTWFSSHPTHTQRIEGVAEHNRGGAPAFDDHAWLAIRDVCTASTVGDDAA